jgi:hypothetical protein
MSPAALSLMARSAFSNGVSLGVFHSTCDECAAIRLDVARMTLEENSLKSELPHAKRQRDTLLLQRLYEDIDTLRRRRMDVQRAYRLHRIGHSRAAHQIV